MNIQIGGPNLVVFSTTPDGHQGSQVGAAHPEGTVTGLLEDTRYQLVFLAAIDIELFVDDVQLVPTPGLRYSFEWRADFFAGRVAVVARQMGFGELTYWLDVAPRTEKLGCDIYQQLLDEVRQADQMFALGMTPATATFDDGTNGRSVELVVVLERLRKYGPLFLKALREVSRRPHKGLKAVSERRPLSAVRRVSPAALRDRNLLLAKGVMNSGIPYSIDTVQLVVDTFDTTADTPANSTLKALALRFQATVNMMQDKVEGLQLKGEMEEQAARRSRRMQLLRSLSSRLDQLLSSSPFREVKDPSNSAAGLTQIAAQPLYARAFRLGCKALRIGIHGNDPDDSLPLSPSWELYERWCFVNLLHGLGSRLGIAWHRIESSTASADRVLAASLADGKEIQVFYQARFPSALAARGSSRPAWSISQERYPDIVITCRGRCGDRFAVLDAKYKASRQRVLEAMSSAHIYKDSLRIGIQTADFALLTLPGTSTDEFLESTQTWIDHGVGTASACRPQGNGMARVVEKLSNWISETP